MSTYLYKLFNRWDAKFKDFLKPKQLVYAFGALQTNWLSPELSWIRRCSSMSLLEDLFAFYINTVYSADIRILAFSENRSKGNFLTPLG